MHIHILPEKNARLTGRPPRQNLSGWRAGTDGGRDPLFLGVSLVVSEKNYEYYFR